MLRIALSAVLLVIAGAGGARGELRLPAIFGDNMVLQRDAPVRVWGWAEPKEMVAVTIRGASASAEADATGKWQVTLPAMDAGGPFEMTIRGTDAQKLLKNVLYGEVWLCSGQSNMQWTLANSNDADLEALTANQPNIRLITVPQVGTQTPQEDFNGSWAECTPGVAREFSAVGYHFGMRLHQTLNVPIGLIDNAWGGSACEAWIRRDLLEEDSEFAPLIERWRKTEADWEAGKPQAKYEAALANWKKRRDQAKQDGKPAPRRPRPPRNQLTGQHRPGNLYNGCLKPLIGLSIRGAIWYQGESNASRAYQYRKLFPLMISSWRSEWDHGDFPFYWVQLADFRQETSEPGDSTWAELREAQTMALDLPNTGQAVITDLGEASDIHPRNKRDVANRLARWALAKNYGFQLPHRSPQFKSMEAVDDKVILTLEHVGGGIDTFDVAKPIGFAIAGEDQQFHWATEAKIVGKDRIELKCADVAKPVAVRYAWADNPVCNVQSREGLPLTPFRTDQWTGVTAENR